MTDAHTYHLGIELISSLAAECIGYLGVMIMFYGTFAGLVSFIVWSFRGQDRLTEIRVDIAKHLSLGLEFLVAKDIIETVISPSLNSLLLLACIIALRTVISYILSWELREAVEEIAEEAKFEEAMMEFEKARKITIISRDLEENLHRV